MQCLCTYYAFFNPYSSIQSSETNTGPLCGEYLCISHVDTSERRHVGTSTRRHNLHFFPQLTGLPPYLFLHFTMNRIWWFCISRCVAPMGLFFYFCVLVSGCVAPLGLVIPHVRLDCILLTPEHLSTWTPEHICIPPPHVRTSVLEHVGTSTQPAFLTATFRLTDLPVPAFYNEKDLDFLNEPLCRPDGAVFLCCVLVSGCVAPLGLVMKFPRQYVEHLNTWTPEHNCIWPPHLRTSAPPHVNTSTRRHVDTSTHSAFPRYPHSPYQIISRFSCFQYIRTSHTFE